MTLASVHQRTRAVRRQRAHRRSALRQLRLAMTPQPLQRGDTFERYLAELRKTPTDATAYLQRELAGNQSEVLDAWASYAQDSRPDKLHDFAAGLLKGAGANAILGQHHIKFSWLLHAAYGLNTLAIAQSLTAGGAAALAVLGGKGPAGEALVRRLERLLMGTQAMLLARESAVKGTVLQIPVSVKLRVPLQEALQARQRLSDAGHANGRTPEQLQRAAKKNHVVVDVVTTNLLLREFNGDVRAALAAGKADLALGTSIGSAAGGAPVLQLTRAQFTTFMARQTTLWEKAALTLREMAQGLKGGGLSLDGHIGLVALLLNGLSVWGSAKETFNSGGDLGKWFAFADSAAGTFGGLAQVTHSALSSAIATRAGQVAAEKSLWVLGAGVAASGAGAFGGIATAAGQFVKLFKAEDSRARILYGFSGASFIGQFTTNGIQFAGAFSEFMITRGSTAAVWKFGAGAAKTAEKFLVRGGLLRIAGMGLTGWGLVFLAGGLIFEIWVVLLTPDALQQHVQNSYFGKGGSADKKYKTLSQEEAGLRVLTEPPPKSAPAEDFPYADPMTSFMVAP